MELARLLEQLCTDIKLPTAPKKDKKGLYQLTLNPEDQIILSELNPGVYFSSNIMPLPKESGKEALFIYLMKANLLGQGTGGNAIGIDAKEKFLTLSLAQPQEINYKVFKESLEDFVNYLDYWREEIPRFQQKLFAQ